jgi:hypothetical protein
MAMGKKKRKRQQSMWVLSSELPTNDFSAPFTRDLMDASRRSTCRRAVLAAARRNDAPQVEQNSARLVATPFAPQFWQSPVTRTRWQPASAVTSSP